MFFLKFSAILFSVSPSRKIIDALLRFLFDFEIKFLI